jgi:hypothetical protein
VVKQWIFHQNVQGVSLAVAVAGTKQEKWAKEKNFVSFGLYDKHTLFYQV